MRIDRWLTSPIRLVCLLFGFQAAFWWVAMPENPVLAGAAPRYESTTSEIRYIALFACFLIGLSLGEQLWRSDQSTGSERAWVQTEYLRRLVPFAIVALLISAIGEAFYVRHLLADPAAIVRAWVSGRMAHLGEQAGQDRIVGLSSLDNLFVFPTAVFALIAFGRDSAFRERKRARRVLMYIGGAVVLHGVLVAARIFVLYYASIVAVAYLLRNPRARSVALGKVAISLAIFASFLWGAETLRTGMFYGASHHVSAVSAPAQAYVRDVLVQGYAASDFNNALVVLDCPSPMELLSTTALRALGSGTRTYDDCPRWQSSFGTVNVLALWWFDFGWFAAIFAILMGGWIAATRAAATAGSTIGQVLFLLTYPGIFTSLRSNYYGSTIFLLSIAYTAICALVAVQPTLGRAPEQHREQVNA